MKISKMEKSLLQFKKDLESIGITLTEKQLNQFIRYYELLIEWNEKINLTAITEFDEVCKKHFVDSLSFVKVSDIKQEFSLIDVGTGAGFPGIPIKILFPNCKLTLLDSLQKRINFLQLVVEELEFSDVEFYHGRAEDFAKPGKLRECYDIVVSRAVANLSSLCELCIPYVKTGGYFISYKGDKAEEEIHQAQNAITLLGGKLEESISFQLPETDYERCLVVIKKEKATPGKYPRKAGTPVKQPL